MIEKKLVKIISNCGTISGNMSPKDSINCDKETITYGDNVITYQ